MIVAMQILIYMFLKNHSIILLTQLSRETGLLLHKREEKDFLFLIFFKRGLTCANIQILGKDFSNNDLLKRKSKDLQTIYIVDFNSLWLIQSGPIALLTSKTDIISITSYSSIKISLRVSSN